MTEFVTLPLAEEDEEVGEVVVVVVVDMVLRKVRRRCLYASVGAVLRFDIYFVRNPKACDEALSKSSRLLR